MSESHLSEIFMELLGASLKDLNIPTTPGGKCVRCHMRTPGYNFHWAERAPPSPDDIPEYFFVDYPLISLPAASVIEAGGVFKTWSQIIPVKYMLKNPVTDCGVEGVRIAVYVYGLFQDEALRLWDEFIEIARKKAER
jgi:hypothetical protein